jgi:hypothetical protein
MDMPRSSEAFSSSTLFLKFSGLLGIVSEDILSDITWAHPKSWRDKARMVDVLPVPGGP